jgi:hypothetical protein
MDFFIWNIKILIFFKFFWVDPSWPGLTHETRDPASWLGQPRTGFNNYALNNTAQKITLKFNTHKINNKIRRGYSLKTNTPFFVKHTKKGTNQKTI